MEEKQLVLVTWRDIVQTADWTPASEVFCHTFQSIGWFISKDDREIKIASTLDYADAFGDAKDEAKPVPYGITAFPAGCVDDIKFL